MTNPSPAWIACRERIGELRQVVGIDQILHAHLQQLRRRALNDLAKSIVDQNEASGGVDLGDADARLAEHGAQHLFLLAQSDFDALRTGDIRAQRETTHRDADHEHDQQQEWVVAESPARTGRRPLTLPRPQSTIE